jgi:AbrB family looped-hinge helix DNA binding protein
MLSQMSTIDKNGRVALPKPMLDALGIASDSEVVIELTDVGIVIKSTNLTPSITQRIADMNLPVADWEEMEQEIDAGRRS